MSEILYRGVNLVFHEVTGGKLIPKESAPFVRSARWDNFEWDNVYWDSSDKNAVIVHQQHQAGYPTSGISTTPHLDRAKFYATHGGEFNSGFIYHIDSDLCIENDVLIYVVSEIVPKPSIPEDDEIILVSKDFKEIPIEVIVKVEKIST